MGITSGILLGGAHIRRVQIGEKPVAQTQKFCDDLLRPLPVKPGFLAPLVSGGMEAIDRREHAVIAASGVEFGISLLPMWPPISWDHQVYPPWMPPP